MGNISHPPRSEVAPVGSLPAKSAKYPASYYWIFLLPSAGALLAFFIAPLAIMFDQSFHRFDGPMQDGPVVYALSNYAKFFSDIFYWQVLGRTLAIAMVV